MEQTIPGGTVHRTIGLLQSALTGLKAEIDPLAVERIGVTVHRAMSMQQRSFHTPEHIFDLSDAADSHTTLAALFHDVVYYQVDEGFLEEIEEILKPYIFIRDAGVTLRDKIPADDRAFFGTAAVFGFTPGQALSPFAGLNEFLSALVMNVLLNGIVRDSDLLIATAGIEMTIPFRKPDSRDRRPPELLEGRVRETTRRFNLEFSEERIRRTVVSAVKFSNRDVQNFAEEDPGRFLDNTWKLIPESNPELRIQGLYSISSYSIALMKMEGFLGNLDPKNVFQQYNGSPEPEEYELILRRVSTNLSTARVYLGIKMISAGLLLALAELTGGDAPMSYFMGDIHPDDDWSHLAAHLTLLRLLEQGRAGSSRFDLQNSPLSLFIYRCMDDPRQAECITLSREYIQGNHNPRDFLDALPAGLVEVIARAAAVMVFTRQEELLKLAEDYQA